MGGRKLNVACVFLGELDSGGGYQIQISTIIELSKKKDYNFIFIVFSKNNQKILNEIGLDAVFYKQSIFEKFFKFITQQKWFYQISRKLKLITKFEKTLKQKNIDLVYFLSPTSLALDLVEHNYIFTIWDLCHRDHPEFPEVNFYRKFEGREQMYVEATKKAIAIITDSEMGRQNAIKRYGLDENRVFWASFLPSVNIKPKGYVDVKKKYNIKEDYIYYPAQFWAHKNHIYILEALKILKQQKITIHAIFSGSDKGNLNYVLNYAKKIGVDELVHYIGFAPNEEIYHLYKQSLALVMPTYFGPTNIPPLEAFAIGTPVIYSDLPGLKDQVGDAALLCDLKKPESLANHLKALIESPSLRNELIQKGKRRLEELTKNSITNVLDKILYDYSIKLKCWKL